MDVRLRFGIRWIGVLLVGAFFCVPFAQSECASSLVQWAQRLRHLRSLSLDDRIERLLRDASMTRDGISQVRRRVLNPNKVISSGALAELEMLELLSFSSNVNVYFPELRKREFFEPSVDFEFVFRLPGRSPDWLSVLGELKSLTYKGSQKWNRFRAELAQRTKKAAYQLGVTEPRYGGRESNEGLMILRINFEHEPTPADVGLIEEEVRENLIAEGNLKGRGLRAIAILANSRNRQWLASVEWFDQNRILTPEIVASILGAR